MVTSLEKLSGNSAKIVSYLAHKSLETGTNLVTISYQMLAAVLHVKAGSMPTTCKRLKKLGIFEILGPGGGEKAVRIFKLHESTLKEFSRIAILKPNTTFDLMNQPGTGADTKGPSMYVGINNNTIHTETPIQPLPDEWADLREVNFSILAPWNIKSSVVDTFKKNKWLITREQLEDLIERFIRYFTEVEFETRRSSIRSPYSLFLNSVKAIAQGEPDPICDVKTQFDLQREIAIKNKQKQLEENKRRVEALEKSLDQYRESEFEVWLTKLAVDEQSKLVPPKAMAQVGSIAYRQLLKAYYTETIWPQFKQTVLNSPRA